MIDRRMFVATCGACLAATIVPHAQFPGGSQPQTGGSPFPTGDPPQERRPRRGTTDIVPARYASTGCYLSAQQGRQLGAQQDQLAQTCGIPWLDQMMPLEARYLNQYFGVGAGFTFLMESTGPNAFATPETIFPGTRGTVLFGLQLMRDELQASVFGTIALAAIMGHEWGHVLQFAHGIQVPGKRMELSSDFMAGWWCGMKVLAGTPAVDLLTVANSLYTKGDYAFNDPRHHGTPDERVSLMQRGYLAATQRGVNNSAGAFALSRQAVGL